MKLTLDEMLGRRIEYPVEVVLATGEKYLITDRDCAHSSPNKRDVIAYPENGALVVMFAPSEVAEIRSGSELL